jgi:hypothetical protein
MTKYEGSVGEIWLAIVVASLTPFLRCAEEAAFDHQTAGAAS